jgi:3-carboxy-cis,cis-muconate cycloisomerase
MARNLGSVDVLGEQRVIAELVGKAPSGSYFGAGDASIDESLDRAKRIVKEHP